MKDASIILISGWAHGAETIAALATALGTSLPVALLSLADLGKDAEGKGPSPVPASPYARSLVKHIARAAGPVLLVGWSTGGMVAVEAAASFPQKMAGLVLVSATARFCSEEGYPHGVPQTALRAMRLGLRRRPELVLNDFFSRAALPAKMGNGEMARKMGAALARGTEALQHGLEYLQNTDLRGALSGIVQPCLVIHGKKDAIVPWRAGEFLHQNLIHCTAAFLPDAGHAMPEHAKDRTAALIREFLENLL